MATGGWRTRLAMRAARLIAGGTWHEQRLRELEAVFDLMAYRIIRDAMATQAVLAAVLRPDSHVIDIGANTGELLEPMIQLAPTGRYLAYEPIPDLARDLADRFPRALVRQVALSDRAGTSTFHHVIDQSGYSGLRLRSGLAANPHRVDEITVDIRALDDDLPVDFRPVLIKADVEGAEVRVFKGSMNTLRRFQPVLLFEHDRTDLYETTSDDLWALLDSCGYRIFNMEGNGPYSRERFSTPAPEWNYMAIPSDHPLIRDNRRSSSEDRPTVTPRGDGDWPL
jgi:FkbM family methyltransferase